MTAQNRKLKHITFDLGGNAFQVQCRSWQIVNNTADGDLRYVFAPNEEFREETDPDWALEMVFFSDWRSGGVSDYLTRNDTLTVAFQLDHYPTIPAEHVRWNGQVIVKAPTVGGDVRTTEETPVTLQCVGKPIYSRP